MANRSSDTPDSSAICFGPAFVVTLPATSVSNRLLITRGLLSSCSFQSSFMFFAFAGLMVFSSFCQCVRSGSFPPASQSALHPRAHPTNITAMNEIVFMFFGPCLLNFFGQIRRYQRNSEGIDHAVGTCDIQLTRTRGQSACAHHR